MTDRKSTMVELVQELEALEPKTPGLLTIIMEAKAGEYHDYKNRKYVCGKHAVVKDLRAEADRPKTPKALREPLRALAQRVIAGEFDEEADEEDKAELRKHIHPRAWPEFGL